jgi:hypothetical protein
MDDLLPWMATRIKIDQNDLNSLIKLEDESITVYAVYEWVHDHILGSGHRCVKSWNVLWYIRHVVDDSSGYQ